MGETHQLPFPELSREWKKRLMASSPVRSRVGKWRCRGKPVRCPTPRRPPIHRRRLADCTTLKWKKESFKKSYISHHFADVNAPLRAVDKSDNCKKILTFSRVQTLLKANTVLKFPTMDQCYKSFYHGNLLPLYGNYLFNIEWWYYYGMVLNYHGKKF